MNHFYLLENPELFQGQKKLNPKTKCYFEGWYFKHSSKNFNISFIPGINIENEKKSAFIQVITDFSSYYISYPFSKFHFSNNPFSITIGDNFFSLDKIVINIVNSDINICGKLFYNNLIKLQKSMCNPNIMGPFSFIPFMECNHAILSMNHKFQGSLTINNKFYSFNFNSSNDGIGYIEKDWGSSFPSSYLWAQANNFSSINTQVNNLCNKNNTQLNNFLGEKVSLVLSVANIPFIGFSFKGFICLVIINGKEYRFATYTGAKIVNYHISKNNFNIKLKDNNYTLHVYSNNKNSFALKAPRCGAMQKDIYESINSKIYLALSKDETILFEGESTNCGLEIV